MLVLHTITTAGGLGLILVIVLLVMPFRR